MARIRTIKPEFCTSENIAECSTSARLLFVELWMFCDDGGVHPLSPGRIKMECFPGDPFTSEDILGWLIELEKADLIYVFESEDKWFIAVKNWEAHQKIDRPKPKYPRRSFAERSSITRRGLVEHSSSTRRRKGREEENTEKRIQTPHTPQGGGCTGFGEFWEAYPKKKNRVTAEKAWKKLRPDPELQIKIHDALSEQSKSKDWTKDGGKFIPLPASWLNERRWEDEADVEKKKPREFRTGRLTFSEELQVEENCNRVRSECPEAMEACRAFHLAESGCDEFDNISLFHWIKSERGGKWPLESTHADAEKSPVDVEKSPVNTESTPPGW